MDIFAGAPQLSTSTSTDTWVVVPPPTQARRMASMAQLGSGAVLEYPSNGPIPEATRTIGRNTVLPIPKEEIIPRAVDAVIDESQGQVAPLLQRTLRRRGLSDSSIHSTFVAQVQQQEAPIMNASGSQGINPLSGAFKTAWTLHSQFTRLPPCWHILRHRRRRLNPPFLLPRPSHLTRVRL
ncbi:hypothetical protein AN958_09081 [Leucoagaricus sp. SymC.cos]|nr:hypothetical protein AN958_09081 [Leucoagaricus sp. SymC.cos]